MKDEIFEGLEISKSLLEKQMAQVKHLKAMNKYDVEYELRMIDRVALYNGFGKEIINFFEMYFGNEVKKEILDISHMNTYRNHYKKELKKEYGGVRAISASDFIAGNIFKKSDKRKSLDSIKIDCVIDKYCPEIKDSCEEYYAVMEALDLDSYAFIILYRTLIKVISEAERYPYLDLESIISKIIEIKDECVSDQDYLKILGIEEILEDEGLY